VDPAVAFYEPINDGCPASLTTELKVENDRARCYRIKRESLPGLVESSYDAKIILQRIQISDGQYIDRSVLMVALTPSSIFNIEIGSATNKDSPVRIRGSYIESAIAGEVRQCFAVTLDPSDGTYRCSNSPVAVKLIRKAVLNDPRINEDPIKEMACTQFVQDQEV